jgi:hypothetical protein
VIELLIAVYRETRRFFGMKRTAGDKIRPRFFERKVRIDKIDDINPHQKIINELTRYASLGHKLNAPKGGLPSQTSLDFLADYSHIGTPLHFRL